MGAAANLNWTAFKAKQAQRKFQPQWEIVKKVYWIKAVDGPFEYQCSIRIGATPSADQLDFETNYKALWNRPATQMNTAGHPVVEQAIRRGQAGTRAMSLVTHDFGDRTSWYQKSVQVVDEILTTTDSITYASINSWWINFTGDTSKLTYQYKMVPLREPTVARPYGNHPDWTISVKVGGTVVTTGFTINYVAGTITFAATPSGVVTATYWHNNNVVNASEFLIVPPPGKKYTIEHVEMQFSKTIQMSKIRFEIWAYPAGTTTVTLADGTSGKQVQPLAYYNAGLGGWFPDALYDAGMGQLRSDYRNVRDFINAANEGKGSIPAVEGLAAETLIFPFNYVQAFTLDSAMNTLFRMKIMSDIAYLNTDITTATFYLIMEPST